MCPKTIFKSITCAIRKAGREEGCGPPLRLVVKVGCGSLACGESGVQSNQEGPRCPTLSACTWETQEPSSSCVPHPPRSGLDLESLPWATVHKEARIVGLQNHTASFFSHAFGWGEPGRWEVGPVEFKRRCFAVRILWREQLQRGRISPLRRKYKFTNPFHFSQAWGGQGCQGTLSRTSAGEDAELPVSWLASQNTTS